MSNNRRAFIKTIGTTSAVLLAGCSSDDEEVQDSDGDGVVDSQDYAPNDPDVQSEGDVSQSTQNNQNSQDTQQDSQTENIASSEPEVTATSFPEPQAVSTNSNLISGSTYEFSAVIENTGEAGDVVITLQWLNDEGVAFEDVSSIERYYSAGERRKETITAELPNDVSRFGFNLVAASITATVENSGGTGEVDVELYNPVGDTSMVIASSTVQMAANETRDVEIELESGTLISDDTEVRAVSAG